MTISRRKFFGLTAGAAGVAAGLAPLSFWDRRPGRYFIKTPEGYHMGRDLYRYVWQDAQRMNGIIVSFKQDDVSMEEYDRWYEWCKAVSSA